MTLGTVEIERLRLEAFHGVLPQERLVGNIFEVTLQLDYDMEMAAATDDVAHALNYADVCQTVKQVMSVPSALLENVAIRLRDALIKRFPVILGGFIKIAKLTPPLGLQLSSCSVTLKFSVK